ncbi:MAG TPA: hypothetical protein PKA41_14260, partial [Verrucomicrobiota bacterium]|nr:hypothetical protein [Verrucomicrobiota bacterium]
MKDSRVSNETSSKRTGWLKILGLVGGVGVVLIAVLYFVVTSGAFFKGVILPKIGKSLNSQLAVSDASISPFSQVVLRDISLIPNGSDKPAFVAKELKARYSLMSIIGGNISVEEVTLASPVIHVIQNADGTSNLDPLTQMEKAGSEPTAKTEAAPLKLSIGTVKLTDGIVRKTTTVNDGVSETLEITGLNITLTNLKNGEDGKLDIAALVTMVATAGPSKPASELSGKLTGNWAFGFTQELKPKAITGRLVFNVDKAGGDYAELLSLSVTAETDVTPTEIRRVALAFAKGGASLGELRVSGPFDMEKVEGVLNADVVGVDKRVLNLAGASAGIDFGDCAVASTNTITVSAGGSSLAIGGRFNLERLRVTQSGQSTPELDLSADYDVKVDNTAETAVLRSFNAAATQNKRPLLNAQLATPMTLNWGKNAAAAGDSALNVTITGLSLGDWRAFAADLSPAGIVNATFKLTSQQAGKQIGFQLNGGITGLSATVGDTKINPSDFRIEVSGRGEDIRAFKLDHYLLALSQQNESGLIVSGSGDFNADTRATDLQLTVQSALPRLLAIVSKDGVNLLSGALQFKGRVQSTAQSQSVAGDLSIDGLRTAGPNTTPLSAKLGLDASVTTNILDLRKCVLSLTPTSRAANQLQLAGRVDMSASDAMTGNLKLTSEALDLTSYYDTFAGQSATKQPAQTPPTTS